MTPPAKAGGFSGDGTGFFSPPFSLEGRIPACCSGQHVAGGVYVPVSGVAARARVHAHAQCFGDDQPAGGTCLARVSWIDQDDLATGAFSLVAEAGQLKQAVPSEKS